SYGDWSSDVCSSDLANVKTCQDENHSQQRQRTRSGAKENRGDSCKCVACCKNELALRNMIAKPAARISRAGVKHVVERIEADGEAGGVLLAVRGREHA